MMRHELRLKLIENGVPNDVYSLEGGLPSEAYCLDKHGSFWEVYYSERGIKSGLKKFEFEEQACDYLYELIIHAHKQRG